MAGIPALTAGGTPTGPELVHAIQDGNSRKFTFAQILAIVHAHTIANVTGLQAALDAKLDDSQAGAGGLAVLLAANAAAVRTAAGLVIGTDVQAYDADLATYAGITPSANVQSVLGAADYAAIRTLLGLASAALKATGTSGNTVPLLDGTNTWSNAQSVPDDAYDATSWNGNNQVPTKNAVRDKIETVVAGSSPLLEAYTFTGSEGSGVGKTFSSLGSFRDLILVISGRAASAGGGQPQVQVNGSTTIPMDIQRLIALGTGTPTADVTLGATGFGGFCALPGTNYAAGDCCGGTVEILEYRGTAFFKAVVAHGRHPNSTTAHDGYVTTCSGQIRTASAISSLKVFIASDQFVAGSVATLYGRG